MTAPKKIITSADAKMIARETAREVVSELFDKLDVNVNDKDSMIKLRDNIHWIDKQRSGQEVFVQNAKANAVWLAGVGILGLGYLLWDTLKLGVTTWVQNVAK